MIPLPYLKIARFLLPYLIGAMIGGLAVGKVQQLRINGLKADITTAKTELAACQDANASNAVTIGQLKEEVKSAYATCGSRLKVKEKMISALRRIDGLKSKVVDRSTVPLKEGDQPDRPQNKGAPNENESLGSPVDPLLLELNGMFGTPADSKD